ncbi:MULTISPECIES: hypothetical protein [Lysinibacillus]|uniref:hypothetical protein n=1 Tax=Lysinibacillus TaxID=400634 RepID=UPI00056341BC|nr:MULTISPECIES: hypothetical protein [Lysinibacillus]SCY87021.1 hypothetical protein SAMN02787078_02801 [Lysinibacillus sp. SG9]SDB38265.1 hypothetical protein SAMN02787079_02841 [Lysinibacillus sp. TC-37]SFT02264.1 hypothetical protein SAMN02787087_03096 [Lysinibacillus sp. SG55]
MGRKQPIGLHKAQKFIIIISAFVFTLFLAIKTVDFTDQIRFFSLLKDKQFFTSVDKNIKSLYNPDSNQLDLSLLTKSISFVNEVILLLILLLVIYYFVLFLMKILNTDLLRQFTLLFKLMKHNLTYISSLKKVLTNGLYTVPFLLPLIFNFDWNAALLIIIVLLISFLFVKYLYVRTYKIIAISLVITIILDFIIIYNFHIEYKKLLKMIDFFTATYSFISMMVIIIWVFYRTIKFEYLIADLEKKILFVEYFTVDKKIGFYSSLEISFFKRKRYSRREIANERARIIKRRNSMNLYISFYITVIVFATALLLLKVSNDYFLKFLIMSLLFISTRFLMRGYEILKAFIADVISDRIKSSSLNSMDRILLIIKSLIEIAFLSFIVKVTYYYLVNDLSSSSIEVKNIINLFLGSFATQLFNVSYSLDQGIFFGIIHIIQIIISSCLILFCFALYSGKIIKYPKYEVTKNLLGKFEVYEYNDQTGNNILEFENLLQLRRDLSTAKNSKIMYMNIKEAYNYLLDWEQKNDELKSYLQK